jgi:uncharacterized protein YbjQ (UPF0145 family)
MALAGFGEKSDKLVRKSSFGLGGDAVTLTAPSRVIVATTDTLPGFDVHMVLGEVIGVALRTFSPFKEGFRSWSDGSPAPDDIRIDLLTRARAEAVTRMRLAALGLGGNAVIAMRFDHRKVTDVMNEVCAYGTAVIVKPAAVVDS